jgi:hypothetical protein
MKLPWFIEIIVLHLRRGNTHEDAHRDVERRRERAERLLAEQDSLAADLHKLEVDIVRRRR